VILVAHGVGAINIALSKVVGDDVVILSDCLLADAGADCSNFVFFAEISDVWSCIVFLEDNLALHLHRSLVGHRAEQLEINVWFRSQVGVEWALRDCAAVRSNGIIVCADLVFKGQHFAPDNVVIWL
jgi:hypothetical protein